MFTVYKVVNLVNGKYYIGVHRSDDYNDDYMGSGPLIKKAIEKYGKENFKKDVLFTFDNEEDAYSKERDLLEDIWENSDCYNLNEGGKGSWSYINSFIWDNGRKNPMKDPNVVKKQIKTKQENGSYHTRAALKSSREKSKLGARARTGMKDSEEVKRKRNESVLNSLQDPEIKRKHIQGCRKNRKRYLLIDPNGIEYRPECISEFCKEMNLPLSSICTKDNGYEIKRGKAKKWKVYTI